MSNPRANDNRVHEQDQREQERREEQQALSTSVARTEERINSLERWQIAQNGSLARIEAKIDAERDKSAERFGALQKQMIGAMVTTILALVGILFTYLKH